MKYRIIYLILVSLLFVMLGFSVAKAQKTDTLYHINGNILTGEIKKYEQGLLYFKMDGMGTLKIENLQIRSLKSSKFLRIITADKKVLYGDIDSSMNSGHIKIGLLTYREEIRMINVVEIFPISKDFWLRLSGKLNFGVDYAKSSQMLRLQGSGNVNYRIEKWEADFNYDNLSTFQELDSMVRTLKSGYSLSGEYILAPIWRLTNTFGSSSNSELGLKQRIYGGFSIKNYLKQTNHNKLYYEVGFNFNFEESTDLIRTNNIDGVIGVNYSIFKYNRPEVDLTSYAYAYPDMRFDGRWRFDSGFDLNVEVFYNFFIGLKAYYQFDSKPLSENANNSDWSFSTTFGYSFN